MVRRGAKADHNAYGIFRKDDSSRQKLSVSRRISRSGSHFVQQ